MWNSKKKKIEYLHSLEEKLRTFDVIDDYDSDYENGRIRAKSTALQE